MRCILRIIYVAIILLASVSCVEKTILDPKEKVVVVNCILTNDSVQTVKLRYSSYVSESYYPTVNEAKVWIEEVTAENTNTYNFSKGVNGVWEADFLPENLAEYKFFAVVGKDTISSTPIVYRQNIRSVDYSIRPLVNKIMARSRCFVIKYSNAGIVWIYGQDYSPNDDKYKIAELIYSDHRYLDAFNITNTQKKNVKEFCDAKNIPDAPPEEPDAIPLDWSIKDGEKDSGDYYMYDRYLRVMLPEFTENEDGSYREPQVSPYDDVLNGFGLTANFKPQYYSSPHKKSHFVFLEVSDEYDRYLLEVYSKTRETYSSDLTDIWKTDNIYSNIEGGKGIFAWANKFRVYYHFYSNFF